MTSPLSPQALMAISKPVVALQVAMQCFTPTTEAICCSNSCTNRPLFDSHLRSKISLMRCSKICLEPMLGRPYM